jgi:hypothetical protein
LKKTDEISSTEKLLHVIRNRSETNLNNTEEDRNEFIEKDFSPSLLTILPFKKKITLSIIIGNHDIILVLLSRVSDQDWNLLDHKRDWSFVIHSSIPLLFHPGNYLFNI